MQCLIDHKYLVFNSIYRSLARLQRTVGSCDYQPVRIRCSKEKIKRYENKFTNSLRILKQIQRNSRIRIFTFFSITVNYGRRIRVFANLGIIYKIVLIRAPLQFNYPNFYLLQNSGKLGTTWKFPSGITHGKNFVKTIADVLPLPSAIILSLHAPLFNSTIRILTFVRIVVNYDRRFNFLWILSLWSICERPDLGEFVRQL